MGKTVSITAELKETLAHNEECPECIEGQVDRCGYARDSETRVIREK